MKPTTTIITILLLSFIFACTKTPPAFRDLNKNGKKDIYEDPTAPINKRVEDLLSQMTLEEKAGMMFIAGAPVNIDASLERDTSKAPGIAKGMPAVVDVMKDLKINHFNIWQIPDTPKIMAIWYNKIQKVAEASRLGIPVTIASDPRNHFSKAIYAIPAVGFSKWPDMPGFAAINDPSLVEEFASIVKQEYMAVGIRMALHPQVDLVTEPRWPRIGGNFSEDAQMTAYLAKAYIKGMQGDNLINGVACMTKHFPGGGPQKEGLDPHFPFQKGQVYPGNNFNYHLIPFESAIEAGTAAIMPYYGVPMGQTPEDVGMSFNKTIITTLLREKYKYDGIVCTDWGLITDVVTPTWTWPARAWGVENLSPKERVEKILNAGVDMFGGESCPNFVIELVKEGKIPEERINQSIRRILRLKFQLGLFDNPYVKPEDVQQIVGNADFQKEADVAQRRSFTLLKNEAGLPLTKKDLKIYIRDCDSSVVAQYGHVVRDAKQADIAIIRLRTPWVPANTDIPFARGFHHGDLDFKEPEKSEILKLLETVPTIVDIYLDRPAVIPEISEKAKALFADYGASDAALLDVIFGKAKPEGKLPFELPRSMQAVRDQKEDVPYDSKDPLYKFKFGLKYP